MTGCADHYQEILKELQKLRKEMMLGNKRLLDVREAANYLGLAERTVRKGVAPKAVKPFPVKPVRYGGKVLFRREDLDAYIDGLAGAE